MAKIERDLGAIVGESAFEFWKSQPGNEGKTESDFLEFLGGARIHIISRRYLKDMMTTLKFKTLKPILKKDQFS